MTFIDRADAGRRLADRLSALRDEDPALDLVVLGLPRGGVPVAAEVAWALKAPLDVIVVRKLGVPFQPELAMGAIGEGGVRVLNEETVRRGRIGPDEIAAVESREQAELKKRAERLRAGRPPIPLAGRTALIIDDGIATGSTARAACQVARAHGAGRVVLAAPVGAPESARELREVADDVIVLQTPSSFYAVGQWYQDFSAVRDEEVVALLDRAVAESSAAQPGGTATGPPACDDEVVIDTGTVELAGRLTIPEHAQGLVVFVHGSGSSRHSPRNREVAHVLNHAGLGTLLFDLLTSTEELDRGNVFDIWLLAGRLAGATRWLRRRPGIGGGHIGYFGASTGAAAALWAAAERDSGIDAVVSRGGRPDLAGERLADVTAPTLLIVGGRDDVVLDLNRQAQRRLRCENRLTVVEGATHLFEEPGALAEVAGLARDWFLARLR